jgi:hypothetical protein
MSCAQLVAELMANVVDIELDIFGILLAGSTTRFVTVIANASNFGITAV